MSYALHTAMVSIVLCPGQGAQHPGMGRAWAQAHPVAAATFAEADRILGIPLSDLCWNGPEDQLSRTDIAQPAIYTTSVAAYRALAAQGRIALMTALAGMSLGEFTALHLAGAFDFETGLRLVRLRGQAMQEAATATPSGMVALVGTDEGQARLVCEESLRGDHEVLVPANFNCPGQIVLSGSLSACERALHRAEQMGIKAQALKVAGAFHSPLMKPAAERLRLALDQATWSTPSVPVMSNVTGILHEINKVDYIKQRLVDQLTGPVRWEKGIIWLISHMPGHFVELAPGRVLSGLMKRIDRSIKVENHAEPPLPADSAGGGPSPS
jgi:[acyl-carrier-protein] S-malonyltransferase